MKLIKLAIFVSGHGTNCENIIHYFQNKPEVNISLVVSSRAEAYAVEIARSHEVPVRVVTRQMLEEEPREVLDIVQNIDYIILAGFLPRIPIYLINRFPKRIINIHPSLLPKFGGKGMWGFHVHEAVEAAHETKTGITIHFVNADLDAGEHIAQFSVPIDPNKDNANDIAVKVHQLEMKHYPRVIEGVIKGNII